MKIVHLITSLDSGGAQNVLYNLLAHAGPGYDHLVVSLIDEGVLGRPIKEMKIPVFYMGFRKRPGDILAFFRLVIFLRRIRPDVLQTWMIHANLSGLLAGRIAGVKNIFWNFRNGTLDDQKKSTAVLAAVCFFLSRFPNCIVTCSRKWAEWNANSGRGKKIMVIPNGFDTRRFSCDAARRENIRNTMGISAGTVVIGCSARWHPQKDHRSLVRAAALLLSKRTDVLFVLCGSKMTADNVSLISCIQEEGLDPDAFRLLGCRGDMADVVPSFDIATLTSSSGEGFPNALGEAMACGIPCVATDVGDVTYLIGDTGMIVPPRQPAALAAAWCRLIEDAEERKRLGRAARARIQEMFPLDEMIARYESLYSRALTWTVEETAVLEKTCPP